MAYIHVPFVRRTACTAVSTTRHTAKTKSRIYADALIQELRQAGRPDRCRAVHAVHGRRHAHGAAGGRSPAHLEVRAVRRARQHIAQDHGGRASTYPGPDKMEACRVAGKPFSLGVQSFDTRSGGDGRVSDRDADRQLFISQSYDQAAVIVISSTASPCRRWNAGWRTSPRPSRPLDGADCYQLTVYRNTRSPLPLRADAFPPGRTSYVGHVRRR